MAGRQFDHKIDNDILLWALWNSQLLKPTGTRVTESFGSLAKYGSCWHTSQRGLPYLASSSVAEEFHKSSLYPSGPRQGGRGGVEQLSDAVVGSLGIHSFPLKKRRLSRSSQSAREIRYALSSFAMSEGS
jgi:hypothetical protein